MNLRLPLLLAVPAVLACAVAPAAASAKAAPSCRTLPVSASLFSSDPTVIRDDPQATVSLRSSTEVRSTSVTVSRNGKTYASGTVAGRLAKGKTSVALTLSQSRTLQAGTYRLTVSGRRCGARRSVSKDVKLTAATLPLRAAPLSTLTGDNSEAVRLILRTVGGTRVLGVQATLVNSGGATVGSATVPQSFADQADVSLPLSGPLAAGAYTLRLTGRTAGSTGTQTVTQPLVFATGSSGDAVVSPPDAGATVQRSVVDWSDGQYTGRDVSGFVAPGIGHGEIVCRPNAQWIRFYPSDLGRESTMMNWTYRDWSQNQEKALREAVHTQYTGDSFQEGLNKFAPPEKNETGQFDGIVTDRGVLGAPFGLGLAAPTTLHLTWVWDFSDPGHERCHVEATFTSEGAGAQAPLVRSAQVVWRGDAAAAGHDSASVDVPGLGPLSLVCQVGQNGNHTLAVDTGQGAAITTRQGSVDETVPQGTGPIGVNLPNNGMVSIAFADGSTLLASSRWKGNDPDPGQNFCAISAQVITP